MGKTYAGVLGFLAFATILTRGLIHGAGFQATMVLAVETLMAFAVIGAMAGTLADWIVHDSIRSRLRAEMTEAKPR